jgi:GntR family transcriptional regulator
MIAAAKMSRRSLQASLEAHPTEPLYRQVQQQILQCLASGEWKPGEQLPTESQLADRFGVAVFTIRAGIGELVASGILLRRQGKGTFVARHGRQRRRYQFSHLFGKSGERILPERELLSFEKEAADDEIAQALRLPRDDRRSNVYRIACLLTVDGRLAATLDIAVPIAKFAGLTAKAIRDTTENIYAVYQDVCGINVVRIDERIHAAIAGPATARSLKIAPGAPVLRVERIAYTYNDTPVEYRVRYFIGDAYCYHWSEGGL